MKTKTVLVLVSLVVLMFLGYESFFKNNSSTSDPNYTLKKEIEDAKNELKAKEEKKELQKSLAALRSQLSPETPPSAPSGPATPPSSDEKHGKSVTAEVSFAPQGDDKDKPLYVGKVIILGNTKPWKRLEV